MSALQHAPLWTEAENLVLASKSEARRLLLAAVGLPFEVLCVDVDERVIEATLLSKGAQLRDVAIQLASAKAVAASAIRPGRLVLGADQTLSFEGQGLHKPASLDEAAVQLSRLGGKTHELWAAFAFARDGQVLAADADVARMTMRPLTPTFIERYLQAAGSDILGSVGAYQVEGLGVHLFERIEGAHSTIMGLPILPVLAFLRRRGFIDS
ncbi:MAG: Maf family protein [Hyphomicrobiales bacterium]|nr:Maf family protein [Hyphomicrobiales bacterium]